MIGWLIDWLIDWLIGCLKLSLVAASCKLKRHKKLTFVQSIFVFGFLLGLPDFSVCFEDVGEFLKAIKKIVYYFWPSLYYLVDGVLSPGPSVFFSCPMDYKAAEGWFATVWNYDVIPYLHQALRSGRKVRFLTFANHDLFNCRRKKQTRERKTAL